MPVRYYVHTMQGQQVVDTQGPYGLTSAKDYARIGSQYGRPRAVTRGQAGPTVRVYSEGRRFWPLSEHVPAGALEALSLDEIPIELAGARADPKLGAAMRVAFWRTAAETVAIDVHGENTGHRFRQLMSTQHGIDLTYDGPICEVPDPDGRGAIFLAERFELNEDQGLRLMAGEVIVKNVPVAELERMLVDAIRRH